MTKARHKSFILASSSPRRSSILKELGYDFKVMPSNLNEAVRKNETAENYVKRIAYEKAMTAVKNNEPDEVVLSADTTVIVDAKILGKPGSLEEAKSMLKMLSNKKHQVYTAICVAKSADDFQIELSISIVYFKEISTEELSWYCSTKEPLGKAGGYAIQGLGSVFVERIEGSYSGIVGLPIFETVKLLGHYDIKLYE